MGKGGFNGFKKGVKQSKEESLKYYKLSADQEYGSALMELADFYRIKDYKKTCEYYKKQRIKGLLKHNFN